MTALTKYQRLEASALWREGPGIRAREVVVGLRDATIVLSDPRSEAPLTQWSLPAVARLNPGQMPARYAPGLDADEEIELDDGEMIAALETVHRVLERRKPRPGRLRGLILAGIAVSVVGLLVFWLPGRLSSYTVSVLPAPTRADLGEAALADLARLTGQPCKSVTGRRAAAVLSDRLFAGAAPLPRIEVLREGLAAPASLPGPVLLLPASLVEQADGPELIAGHLLAEALRAAARDPALPLLSHAGLGAAMRLLTTGALPPDAVQGYGETLLAAPPGPAPALQDLQAAFRTAEVSAAAYARATPPQPGLLEADPYPLGSPRPVLSDEDWLEFQAICQD